MKADSSREGYDELHKVIYLSLSLLLYTYFLFASLLYLVIPGLVAEEAYIGLTASTYLKGFTAGSPGVEGWSLIPPSLAPYKGPTTPLLMTMLMAVFGNSVVVLRSLYVAFALGSLISIQFVVRIWFNRSVALVTVLLLGINSTFIQAGRIGALRNEVGQIFFFWLGLVLVQLALDREKKRYLYGAAFVFGLGLAAKVMMLGYLIGGGMALLAVGRVKGAFKGALGPTVKTVSTAFAAFLAGCSGMIINYASEGLSSLQWMLWNFSANNQHGWDNRDILGNLATRMGDTWQMLSNNFAIEGIQGRVNMFFPFLAALSVLGIAVMLRFVKGSVLPRRPVAFLAVLYSVLFLTTCFVPTSYHAPHVLVLLPAPQIAVALFVISLISLLKSRLAGGAVVVLLLVPALTIDVMTGVEHLAAIKDGSLTGERSTVLYEVSDYLVENGIGRVAPMNSKNDLCLLYISDNQVSLSFGVSWPKESLKNPKDKVREQNVGEAFALREGRLPAEVGFSHIIAHPAEENGRYYILAAPEDPRWSFPFMDLRALLHELGRPFRLEHRFSSPGDEFSLDLYYFE